MKKESKKCDNSSIFMQFLFFFFLPRTSPGHHFWVPFNFFFRKKTFFFLLLDSQLQIAKTMKKGLTSTSEVGGHFVEAAPCCHQGGGCRLDHMVKVEIWD